MDKKHLIFMGLGFELLGFALSGIYVGSMLDSYFSTEGLWTVGLIFVFLAAWFFHFYLMIRSFERNRKKEDKK